MSNERVVVAIVTPLKDESVALIRAVDDRVEVRYEPDLLPPLHQPPADRSAGSFRRTPEQENRWYAMLVDADVLFGLPGESPQVLAEAVRINPGLSWVQATAAGVDEQVRAAGLTDPELGRVLITSAAGVRAGPLAEFAILGMLAFTQGLPRLLADQQAHRWEHDPMAELAGSTVLVVGWGQSVWR